MITSLNTVVCSDALTYLQGLPENSMHCMITSPPYFGLRDYGIDNQIGLENTPELYVENLVTIFREARRVLRKDGVFWLNLGDSYWGSWGNAGHRVQLDGGESVQRERSTVYWNRSGYDTYRERPPTSFKHPILKRKDLIGIPWRVALALQNDGWYLRSDVVWHKPNSTPESVRDAQLNLMNMCLC